MPRISVVVTSYEQRQALAAALDSVLAQTHLPHEIVVVDDASGDGSPELIRAYAERHPGLLVPLLLDANGGVSRARNAGIDRVTGELISTLDGDDRYLPEKLERELAALERTGATLAYSDLEFVDSRSEADTTGDGTRGGERRARDRWLADVTSPPEGDLFAVTVARSLPGHGFFRFELVAANELRAGGLYDVELDVWEDWDLAVRLARSCRAAYSRVVGVEIHRHGGGLSSTAAHRHLAALRTVSRRARRMLLDRPAAERRALRAALDLRLGKAVGRTLREHLAAGRRAAALQVWLRGLPQRGLRRADVGALGRAFAGWVESETG